MARSEPAAAPLVDGLAAAVRRVAQHPLTLEQCVTAVGIAQLFPGVFAAAYDPVGRYIWVSDALEALTGTNAAHLLGRRITEFFGASWCEERLAIIRQTLQSGRPLATVEIFRGRRLEAAVFPVQPGIGVVMVGRFGLSAVPVPSPNSPATDLRPLQLEHADWGPLSTLTRRELEVLRFIACGLDNAEIAERLHRSKRAVEWHVKNLYDYLRCHQRTELFRIGLQAGLPDIDTEHWDRMIVKVRLGPDHDQIAAFDA